MKEELKDNKQEFVINWRYLFYFTIFCFIFLFGYKIGAYFTTEGLPCVSVYDTYALYGLS